MYNRILFMLCILMEAIYPPIALADYEDGLNAALSGDFQTAFREFSIAAEAGLDVAQYNLAILYYKGQGVDQDLNLAFRWTNAAANQGHPGAQANLGSLFLDGSGVEKDVVLGVAWLEASAKSGHADSAITLAKMYNDGDLVAQDYTLSHAWASMALQHQHPEAESLRALIESRLTPSQLSAARRTFARWQIEPAELPSSGNP